MKRFVGLVLLFGLLSCTPNVTPPITPLPRVTTDPDMVRKLDRYLTRLTNKHEFSGVALVARGGEVVLKKAYGLANTEEQIPNTVDTRFQVASVGKTLTATGIMLLAQRGKVELDAPIATYLGDVPTEWKDIRVVDLLAHTSGIPDYFSFDEFDGVFDLTTDGIIEVAKTYPLDFEPGSGYEYSNTGYVLLGKMIENVSGKSYGEYMRGTIFDPLGMTATGREQGNTPLATGYASYGAPARMFPITNALGDGDFYSTVEDLYRFDRVLYDDAFLSRELRERMFTPVGSNNYGLGWEVQEWKGKRVVSHSGHINGFASELMRFPEQDTTIILLSNVGALDGAQTGYALAEIVFE